MISKLFAVVIVITGIALAVYVGGWLLFVGGIVQVVEGFKATPVASRDVGIGALKFVCAGIGGWAVLCASLALAAFFWADDAEPRRSRGSKSARQVELDWERVTRQ